MGSGLSGSRRLIQTHPNVTPGMSQIVSCIERFDPALKPGSFEQAVMRTFAECWEILMTKRAARGVDNLVEQGQSGIVDRVFQDKGARIRRQIKLEQLRVDCQEAGMPQGIIDKYLAVPYLESTEPLESDIMDCINYLVMLILLRDGRIGLPFGESDIS